MALNITKLDNRALVDLYKVNKKLCVIIMLGQGKSHGMGLLSKTKSDNYPNGVAWEFVKKAQKANKLSDASAVIKLDVELEWLQLKSMRDFSNDVVGVMDKYEVTKSDCKMCMLMV
jgi:hypothetical protein